MANDEAETSQTAGRCAVCRLPIDDHHLVIDPSVLGKSTVEGNRYYVCPAKSVPPPQPDQGVNNA